MGSRARLAQVAGRVWDRYHEKQKHAHNEAARVPTQAAPHRTTRREDHGTALAVAAGDRSPSAPNTRHAGSRQVIRASSSTMPSGAGPSFPFGIADGMRPAPI